MEENIKKEAQKEAEEYWEKNIKDNFNELISKHYLDVLINLKNEMKNFDESLEKHIQFLDTEFSKNFDNQISELQQKTGVIINNKNNNQNNTSFKEDDILRKKYLDIKAITFPSLKKLILPPDSNQLINLIFYCLVNIKTLILYYFNPEKEKKIMWNSNGNPNVLGSSFLKLIDNYWKSKSNEYAPVEMHQAIKKIMKKDYYTQNPGIIFQNILFKLNSELSMNQLNENLNIKNDPYLTYNRDKIWKIFLESKQIVKISNCFFNLIETEKRCETCNTSQYSFEDLPIINIYLQENEDKNYNNKLSFMEHYRSLLMDKKEEVSNEKCIICGDIKNKFVTKHILETAEIIIININRNNDVNNNVEFNYPENFEKKDFINQYKNPKFDNKKYELFCTLKKYKNNNNFEYKMFCKNFVNEKWYLYNDTNIKESNIKDAMSDGKYINLIIYKNIN